MSYHCGIGPRLGSREPHFVCDGCGLVVSPLTQAGHLRAWMLKDQPRPPGWRRVQVTPDSRIFHYCKKCPR